MIRLTGVSAPLSYDEAMAAENRSKKKLHISEKTVEKLEVFRRSVDARKKRPQFTLR